MRKKIHIIDMYDLTLCRRSVEVYGGIFDDFLRPDCFLKKQICKICLKKWYNLKNSKIKRKYDVYY